MKIRRAKKPDRKVRKYLRGGVIRLRKRTFRRHII